MKTTLFFLAMFLFLTLHVAIESANAIVHPGILHTQADIDRMKAKVDANESPWIDGWNKLIANSHAQTSYTPNPQAYVCCGSNECPDGESFMPLANDCAAAYQCALRYRISGNTAYADKAIQIMNAWVSTFVEFTGDSNMKLRAGLYGYQFAAAAELLREYSGWSSTDFNKFKNMMLDKFYTPHTRDFLDRHNDTCFDHYWANWDLSNMASCLAIAILCDDQAKFDHAIEYFKSGVGTGQIDRLCNNLYDGDPILGQCQESGRDQGHATLCMSLIGAYCQIAYNQGEDLFAYEDNKVLALCEYTAKYNLGQSVPFTTYTNCENNTMTIISSEGRGTVRPAWELIYNHYVNIKGLNAPYSQQWASDVRPEGGGGDYGSNSGGFDQLGFGTLTYTVAPGECASTAITPYLSVDNGSWQQTSTVAIDAGSSVKLGPQPETGGIWSWSGCGTSGTSREQTVSPTSTCTAIATYTNSCGTKSSQIFTVTVNSSNCDPTSITPVLQVDDGSWQQTSNVTIDAGSSVKFGPKPETGGSWSWSGCGSSGTSREYTVSPSSSCTSIAIFTNDCGAESTQTFDITVNSTTTISTLTLQENSTGFCSVDGSVDNNNSGFTGDGFANTDNASGNGISWSVNVPSSGTYSLAWNYANGGTSDRTAQLMLDGSTVVSKVSMVSTESWSTWSTTSPISMSLSAGTKLIRLEATNSSGLSNIDYMSITGINPTAEECTGLKKTVVSSLRADKTKIIYPNPATNILHVMSDIGSLLKIYDNLGRMVFTNTITQNNQTINVTNLKPGIYFVKISVNGIEINKKLVKK